MDKDQENSRSTRIDPEKDDGYDELTDGGEDVLLEAEEEAVAPEEQETVPDATPEDEEEREPLEYVIDDSEEDAESEESAPVHKLSKQEVLRRLLEKNEILMKLNKDNILKDRQIKEVNEKWIRSVAEFENYRKRTRKEWELLKTQAKGEIILEVLSVVDDFERAFTVVEDDSDEFVQGIKLIYNNLLQSLDRFGVTEVQALHEPFDPTFHMAVGQMEADKLKTGQVAEVVQKGYRLDETVIRPARVIVAK